MFVVRPVKPEDLDVLVELAGATTFGLTTLRMDREQLAERIADSLHGFANLGQKPRGESFLMLMEDLETHRAVGTCGIVSKVGGFEPFYAYRIEASHHQSDELNVLREIPTLHLVAEHNGPCEIGSLFLLPEFRSRGLGRLLALSRFLFMAEFPDHFDPSVIAELRGVIDDQGRSPFWEAIGRHFFDLEFPHADALSMTNKQFIADLMPKHPIYVPLLPPSAQEVLGKVHPKTEPALRLLESEGFSFNGMVDIFEAGPVVSCCRDRVRTIRESTVAVVDDLMKPPDESPMYLICRQSPGFRAGRAKLTIQRDNRIKLGPDAAALLGIDVGDTVRYVLERGPATPASEAAPNRRGS